MAKALNMVKILHNRQALIALFVVALLMQTAATLAAAKFFGLPISTESDTVEYIRTADNLLAGHGFSIDTVPPFRPNGFRTPGPLLLNIPLRLLASHNDIAAVLITRLVLLIVGILCILLAAQFGVNPNYALLAGPLIILNPTIFYYSMLPYSTELPYALVYALLSLGTVLYLKKGRLPAAILIGGSAFYALALRPAAQFVLIPYVLTCGVIMVAANPTLRRRVLIAGLSCLLGGSLAYVSWCWRNYVVFHAFQYSTVSGENLLRLNAAGMKPFLNENARQELAETIENFPVHLKRYSGADQFVVSREAAAKGLHLIFEHPVAFVESHMLGTAEATVIFRPESLQAGYTLVVVLLSIGHLIYLCLGAIGAALLYRSLAPTLRAAMLITLVAGIFSVLTGGALRSPRFSIPLDVILVVGLTYCVAKLQEKVTRPAAFATASAKVS